MTSNEKKNIQINTEKSKCLIFHRGRLPKCSFTLNGRSLEIVNSYSYLGFTFSTLLSFTEHVRGLVEKANSRCGILRSRLPLNRLPLHLVLSIFSCYTLPIFRYGLPLWLSSISNSIQQSVNAVFTKFLKTYLGVPFSSNNAITHFVTNTGPLMQTLREIAPNSLNVFLFPEVLHGHCLSFIENNNPPAPYDHLREIPTFFWRSKIFSSLPVDPRVRKSLCRELFDTNHNTLCATEKFHGSDRSNCKCLGCGQEMQYYHQYFCPIYNH